MHAARTYGPLLILTLLLSLFQVAYVVARVPLSEPAMNVISYSLIYYLLFWVVLDARRRRRVPCYDFGFLVYLFLPIALTWYVFWTRGWRGFLTLAFLLALFLTPPFCVAVAQTLVR